MLVACGGEPEGQGFFYPLDDLLRFNHLQAKGTHNSFHVETDGVAIEEWNYTHLPLDRQMAEQGVRQFELDVYWTQYGNRVYHVPLIDQGSTCDFLVDCLADLKSFSDDNPAHHPIFVLVEPKTPLREHQQESWLAELEEDLLSVWPEDRLVTPDSVRGEADSLSEQLADGGWPTLGALRGKALFVLHTGGSLRDLYTDGGRSAAGCLLFPDAGGDLTLPFAAVHTVNNPVYQGDTIAELAEAGHLVRTRSDADLVEAREGDDSRHQAALASGAHFLSTDVPVPRDDLDYLGDLEGGTPSRCNPLTAPVACTAEAIEDPRFIGD